MGTADGSADNWPGLALMRGAAMKIQAWLDKV
jgi:hypothetical protein